MNKQEEFKLLVKQMRVYTNKNKRPILAFIFTPAIACLISMLIIFLSSGKLNMISQESIFFTLLIAWVAPSVFMSLFVYPFEIFLFFPMYVYLQTKDLLNFWFILTAALIASLMSGFILSYLVHGEINYKFLLFSSSMGIGCGFIFWLIHGKSIHNNLSKRDSLRGAPF